MSYYGNYAELLKDGDKYGCNCIDGQCSNCGECCTETLPLTKGELLRLKQYAAKHKLKEHRQAPFWDWHSVDLTCPFRNQQTKKCEAYQARPYICRTFICSKTKEDAHRDRDLVAESRQYYSLRWEVFGNDEVLTSPIGPMLSTERKRK